MEVIKVHKSSDKDGVIHLDIPTHFYNCETNVVVIVEKAEKDTDHTASYDFSDLAGKLEWTGDSVAEQRSLREEW